MSYTSSIKTLPAQFNLPTGIAVLASLGIHGILALSLPKISTASKLNEAKMHGTVEVVELTPAEQSRLPQAASESPVAYQTQPLPPTQSLPYSLQPIPRNNPSSNLPDIRLPPATRFEPQQNNSRINTQRSVRQSTPRTTRESIQTGNNRRYRLYSEPIFKGRRFNVAQRPSSGNFQSKPDNSSQQERDLKKLPPLVPRTFDPPSDENLNPQRPNNEGSDIASSRGRDRQLPDPPDIPSSSADNLKPQSTPTPTPPVKPNSSSQTANNSKPPSSSEDKTAPQTNQPNQRQQQLLAELQEQRRSLTRDESNTKDEDARKNYINWSVARGKAEEPEKITVSGVYPKTACIKKLEGTPVVAVLVDAKNNVSKVSLMKSSGYPVFNEKALEDAVKLAKFNNKT